MATRGHVCRLTTRLALAVALAAGTVASVAGPVGAAGSGCTAAQLVPQLREFDANQGLAAYSPLTYGKNTLVKLFLSLPTCATTGQSIQLNTGSTLVVGNGATSTTVTAAAPPAGGPYPAIVASSQAPALNSTGDPIFNVPGSALAPPPPAGQATANAFTATFTATVNYLAKTSNSATPVAASITFSSLNGSALTASVDKQGDALRVLVVPMGDATSSTTQFGSGASTAVQNAMGTLSRVLPVPAGIASLTAAAPVGAPPPGLRYTVNSGLLDLGPSGLNLMNLTTASTLFCGTATSYNTIKSQLSSILTAWNTNNPSTPANRVLGVVDEAVSTDTCTGGYEGIGSVNGAEAWVRAFYKSTSPNETGALAGMELGHTMGMTPTGSNANCTDLNGDGTYHSLNIAADGCSPGRAYNVATASYVAANRTVMFLSTGWTNDTVVYEKEDNLFAQCVLGGSSTTCAGFTNTGGFAPAAGGTRFVISGKITVNGSTSSAATVNDSYLTSNSQYQTQTDPTSRWTLDYLGAGGAQLLQEGLVVSTADSAHGGPPPAQDVRSFVSSRQPPASVTRVELRDNATTPATVLYARDLNAPPTITATSQTQTTGPALPGTVTDYTNTPSTNEARPALSANGLLAWSTPGGLLVARTNDPARTTFAVLNTAGATNPSFSRDSSQLAYELNGSIDTIKVTWDGTPTGTVTFGPPTTVYDAGPLSVFPAHHPSFSPAADRLVLEFNHNLFVVFLAPGSGPLGCALPGTTLLGSCSQITNQNADSDPSWAPSGNLIASARSDGVWSVDASGAQAPSLLVSGGADPSWAAGLLAFRLASNVWVADPTNVAASKEQLTGFGADARPSLVWSPTGGQLAFERQLGSPSQSDVMLLPLSPNAPGGTTTYTVTASDDQNPGRLRAQFLRVCPDGHREILAAGLAPRDANGSQAGFRLQVDPAATTATLGCAGASVATQVSDGVSTASASVGTIPDGNGRPVAAISSPRPGTTFRQGHLVGLVGSGYDANGAVLPLADDSWAVTGPGASGPTQAFNGTDRVYLSPAAGTYTATLTAADGAGTATAQTTFTVVADSPPVATINSPAPGSSFQVGTAVSASGSASDAEDGPLPSSALDWSVQAPDGTFQTFPNTATFTFTPTAGGTWSITLTATDSDGSTGSTSETIKVVNPTVPATVNFSPSTLNVPPLPSDSNWVTVQVRVSGKDLTQVDPNSLIISQIGTFNAGNDPNFPTLKGGCLPTGCSAANGWQVTLDNGVQVGVVQFDRRTLANYLLTKGLVNQYVPITVFGSAPTWNFSGADPRDPFVS